MKPFHYHPANSVRDAIGFLEQYGDETELLSGGTSIMLLGRLGLSQPEHVIGLSGIQELRGISTLDDGWLRIGALTTLREIETSTLVLEAVPGLVEAVSRVATIRIRNQATIGGNLAHADPAQDTPPMLIALGAEVEAEGPAGRRRFSVEDLSVGFMENSLAPNEVLTAVFIQPVLAATHCGYYKFLPRTEDDFATVSVAACITTDDDIISHARVVFGASSSTPVRARHLEDALIGTPRTRSDGWIREATLACDEVDPMADQRGSIAYKRAMSVVCASRLLDRLLAQ